MSGTRLAALVRSRAPGSVTRLAHAARRRLLVERARLRALGDTERLRPSFLVIGATKSGTTALFSYLVRHPRIVPPIDKGIRYFDQQWARPAAWYLAHFPRADRYPQGTITGEATSFYMAHPRAPQRVRQLLPEVRLIAILRNPVTRAISHYFHQVRAGTEQRPIEEAMFAPESLALPEALSRDGPVGTADWRLMRHSYVARGLYAEQLARWLALFGREQILVLRSEDLRASTAKELGRTVAFLGLEPADVGVLSPIYVGRYGGVDQEVIERLQAIFAEPNQRLGALLGRAFDWSTTARSAGAIKSTRGVAVEPAPLP